MLPNRIQILGSSHGANTVISVLDTCIQACPSLPNRGQGLVTVFSDRALTLLHAADTLGEVDGTCSSGASDDEQGF